MWKVTVLKFVPVFLIYLVVTGMCSGPPLDYTIGIRAVFLVLLRQEGYELKTVSLQWRYWVGYVVFVALLHSLYRVGHVYKKNVLYSEFSLQSIFRV